MHWFPLYGSYFKNIKLKKNNTSKIKDMDQNFDEELLLLLLLRRRRKRSSRKKRLNTLHHGFELGAFLKNERNSGNIIVLFKNFEMKIENTVDIIWLRDAEKNIVRVYLFISNEITNLHIDCYSKYGKI